MQAEIPAEEPQVDAAHPQRCVPADFQPLPACRHQPLSSDVWGTVRPRFYCFCHSFKARWPSEQLQETQIKLLIHHLKCTFHLLSPIVNPDLVPHVSSDGWLQIQGFWGSKAHWIFTFIFPPPPRLRFLALSLRSLWQPIASQWPTTRVYD